MSSQHKQWQGWLNSRPPAIRELARKCPPGTCTLIDGVTHWIIGYAETVDDPGYLVTPINPSKDYDAAVAAKRFVCSSHLT